ncbi:MAG: hypothetical protein IPK10_20330 [Bacteroidetes bacterium]|nr:hypothetical protein [Bacteroidota bacterium]
MGFSLAEILYLPIHSKIPAGARLKAIATFDNTVNNPNNPNNPPIMVQNGPLTTDEMLMTYFIYSNYQTGDENILLDSSLLSTFINEVDLHKEELFLLYPNPSDHVLNIQSKGIDLRGLKINVRNSLGQLLLQNTWFTQGSTEQISIRSLPTEFI